MPAYKLARRNVPFTLEPVEVEIKHLEVRDFSGVRLEVAVTCSAGTYIRSLAHDLGLLLGCGAILSDLRRIRAGAFSVEQAHTISELEDLAAAGRLPEVVIPAAFLLPDLPAEHFDSSIITQIRQGRDFRTSPFVVRPGAPRVKALSRSGELVAIGELVMPNLYHPSTVL